MCPIQIRPARRRDLLACARMFVRSARDLDRRQGRPPIRIRPRDMIPFLRHALSTDPRGFQIAVSGKNILCLAVTILRGKTHFLALFFAHPGAQSQGIGRRVLARAFQAPNPPRGAVRCLVASLDFRAQALYLKFGMQPRTIVYHLAGRIRKADTHGPTRLQLRQVGLGGESTKRSREIAARFDRELRGVRRDVDQRFFLRWAKGSRFFEAQREGRLVGYVVIRGNGAIGPGGVLDPSHAGDLLTVAFDKARALGLKKVSIWVPGLNEGAVRASFEAGLKVDFMTVWMSAKPIGHLEKYLPSSGLLF